MSHFWGDEWFEKYGDDLYYAQMDIIKYTKRWSRCQLLSKEKYGTIRYEHILPPGGHVVQLKYAIWAPWKRKSKYIKGGYRPLLFAWNQCWLYYKWQWFGAYICGKAIQKAVKKYPHLEVELCCDVMFETKFGKKCQDRYWRTL